ncbi:MAG: precorrin-2 C(20)-methyltransferase [Pseudonocardiales bacterium]|nr:precorrin-2 C(20)-methyltransferase [Actinomycetota bacterium]PZS24366.1 MAG: precorrin-2 C(20)-methyltransferase [Pseudonocardiales bacterium]
MELVGIGVGPGDPDLLTVAAVRELSCAGRIFVPVMAADVAGRAEAVVRVHLTHNRLERLVFALNDDVGGSQRRRHDCWDAAAARVVAHLRERAGSAAFATLGDPSVYSTFGYLAKTVRELLPDIRIRTVPGITAMQAAASAAGLTLVEGSEPLTLLPLTRDLAALDDALAREGAVVVYKGGRRLAQLRERVAAVGALDRAWCAEHVGTPDERVTRLRDTDAAAYLSTVVVLPPRSGRGAQL